MNLDTLITEADPARRVPLPGHDSAEGIRLYHRITTQKGRSRREAHGHAQGLAVAGVAVSSLAIAAAVTIAVVPGSPAQPAPGRGKPASAVLAAAALTAASGKAAGHLPGPGQFLYVQDIAQKGLGTSTQAGCRGKSITQAWMAPDASGREVITYPDGGCKAARVTYPKGKFPWWFGNYAASGLPARPANLERAIVRHLEGGHARASATFVYASEFLDAGTRPALRAALYRMIERLPGIEDLGPATDGLGRHGVAVGLVTQGARSELIFDPATSAALEWKIVAVAPGQSGNNHLPAGMVMQYNINVVSGIVNSDTGTPPGAGR
jgi:hypothetical protein